MMDLGENLSLSQQKILQMDLEFTNQLYIWLLSASQLLEFGDKLYFKGKEK